MPVFLKRAFREDAANNHVLALFKAYIEMTNSNYYDNISMFFTSLVQGLRENLIHPVGFMQIGAIGVTYLIAWLFAAKFGS